MSLTPKQRACLASVCDGEWRVLAETHAVTTVSTLVRWGYIRDDMSYGPIRETSYTITPDGIRALEAKS